MTKYNRECVKCKEIKELFQFNLCVDCILEIKEKYPLFKYMLNREYGFFNEKNKIKNQINNFKLIGYFHGKPIFKLIKINFK